VENDHIMVDSAQVAEDFNMNASEVEARHTRAQTGAYLSSDQAITAFKQMGMAVVTCTGLGSLSLGTTLAQVVVSGSVAIYNLQADPTMARVSTPVSVYEFILRKGK
jgi:LDH2 family malate/lactate/ureidoglycolate dehydrogenase